MRNIFRSLFLLLAACLTAQVVGAKDVTFTMSEIFDGQNLSFDVTTPVAANVSSNTSKSNAKAGKLGSDGHYFQIVLSANTFTAASINGFINTTNTEKNWAFQFSTDGGSTWTAEATQANDGNKTAHDITVGVSIPSGANGFRVVRRAGTSTQVSSITLTLDGGSTPPEPEKSHDAALKSLTYGSESTSVPDFAPTKLSYSVVLPSDYVGGAPSIQAETNDEKADLDITQASSLPGTATAKVTAEDGTTITTYKVSFSVEGTEPPATIAVTGVSLNKTTLTLKEGATFSLIAQIIPSEATNQNVSWKSSNTAAATIAAGVVTAKAAGTADITVTTEDGGFKATCKVTVEKDDTPTPPVPSTTLTLHEPGIYEEVDAKGGYDAALSIFGQREYEIFYAGRFEEKVNSTTVKGITIQVNPPVDKMRGITKNESETYYEAIDGWFKGNGKDKGTGFGAQDEFITATERCHTLDGSAVVEMHIKGYDQFSIYAIDKKLDTKKPENNKYLKIVIDDVEQPADVSTSAYLHRYDIPATEHVIKIVSVGDGNLLGGFSLRVAQVPAVKYLRGNDSTQVVPQTENLPRAITYYTKYNKLGETRVIWEDQKATGIDLIVKSSTEIGDTLQLTGQAMCPVGVYPFHVSSFDGKGVETKRLKSGKITVTSDIRAIGEPKVEVYQGEAMEELEFSYHALDASAITLTWTNGTPDGITGHGEDGKYYISGTPTQIGEFTFTISVLGGNSIDGLVSVKELVIGDNPVLYLYTNAGAYDNDGVAEYLTSLGYDFVPRKAKRDGLRPDEDYKKYNWVLISEDANADNAEVLALTQQSSILPVLNMKSFSYTSDRLGWGDPNNGSLTPNGQSITIQRDDHPIFKDFHKGQGGTIQVLSEIVEKGLMPIDIDLPGTLCLATSLTRAKEDYYGDGEQQTFLHEVPANMRGGKKYICMPIAISSSKKLTATGKQLVEAVVNYLLSSEASIQRPQLQITQFIIPGGPKCNIDEANSRITAEIDLSEWKDVDKFAIAPTVEIISAYTHVTPASGKTMDFSESMSFPVAYEVSDFINRRVYEVAIRFFSSEGIEDVYAVGDWVNIYDIYGRKVSTTNEDIYHMALPRGIYVIVTETGETFKIMR